MFELGQRVTVKAIVKTTYSWYRGDWEIVHAPKGWNSLGSAAVKILVRKKMEPIDGMIVGYTFRYTGKRGGGWNDEDPAYLLPDKAHKVWMVATTRRWRKPMLVLERDLIPVDAV